MKYYLGEYSGDRYIRMYHTFSFRNFEVDIQNSNEWKRITLHYNYYTTYKTFVKQNELVRLGNHLYQDKKDNLGYLNNFFNHRVSTYLIDGDPFLIEGIPYAIYRK